MTPAPGGGARVTRSIRFRIAAAFVVLLVSTVASQGWLVAQQAPVRDSLRLVTEGYLPLSKQVARLRRDQERVQRDLNRLRRGRPRPVTGETTAAEIYTEELRDNLAEARARAELVRQTADPSEQAVFAKAEAYLVAIEEQFVRYEQQSAEFQEQLATATKSDDVTAIQRRLITTSTRLREEVDKLERTLEDRITALTVDSERRQTRATAVAAGLGLVALLLGVGLLGAVFVALRPIAQLTAEVQRVAAGERGARVQVGGDDEIGLLAAEFNQMALAIEERDRSLKERAAQLDKLSRYLGSVVDSLDDGLVVVEQGVVTLTNPAAARAWGIEVDAAPPEALASALGPGRHELAGADGRRYAVACVPFGERGVVAVLTDVTDQVAAQERLARSERLALIGQMLAQITHEVRNPLNALGLNAELLSDELERLDPERGTEAWDLLGMIAGEVDRLTGLTGHYLQLARRPPAQLAPCDVVHLVDDVVRLVEPELEVAGVTLARAVDDPGPVLADEAQLRRAVLNVLRNALEAGARQLTVRVAHDAAEVRIAVEDDGPGMTPEEAAQATDPFWSTKASGTGLGLAITRQTLEDHDGRVVIERTPSGGTVVALVWPLRTSTDGDSTSA